MEASTPARPQARFYRPELDGLRFVAFTAVYCHHTFELTPNGGHRVLSNGVAAVVGPVLTAGAFGVDLFFALSAYLITELLLREKHAFGRVDVPAFYVRRALRIWPLYFFFLLLAYALAWLVPGEQMTWRHLLGYTLFAGNWVYMWKPVATVAAPLWSISVEEQFYLAWPWLVRHATTRRIAVTALGLSAMGVAYRLIFGSLGLDAWIAKSSFGRVDGLVAGILLAVALRGRRPRTGVTVAHLGIVACLATLVFAVRGLHIYVDQPPLVSTVLGWPLVAAACAGLVAFVLVPDNRVARFLSAKPLVHAGRISYGLYVFHELGLLIARHAFAKTHGAVAQWALRPAFALAVTWVLAETSYNLLEKPFLALKQRRFTAIPSRPEGPEGPESLPTPDGVPSIARP